MNSDSRFRGLVGMLAVSLLLQLPSAVAEDWPQFRGPNRSGISNETGLPLQWSASQNILWKLELPGPGSSSPIVFDNRVYVTCYSGYGLDPSEKGDIGALKRHLISVDVRTGKILWTRTETDPDGADTPCNATVQIHGYSTHTPVADPTGVYAYFGSAGAVCYGHDGQKKWRRRLGDKAKLHGDGSAASPLLHQNLFIVNAVVETAEAFRQGMTVALDKTTGAEVWREKVGGYWSSPVTVTVGGKTELVVATFRGPWLGLDPLNGRQLWQCQANNDGATPVAHEGTVYTLHESGRAAIKAGGRGDVTETHKLWEAGGGSQISSPVYHDGHLHWAGLDHCAKCVDARSGKRVYSERLGAECYASAVSAEGRIYYVSRNEGTYVISANPKFELLAHNTLEADAGTFNGSPAISGRRLFLRSDKSLYCIMNR